MLGRNDTRTCNSVITKTVEEMKACEWPAFLPVLSLDFLKEERHSVGVRSHTCLVTNKARIMLDPEDQTQVSCVQTGTSFAGLSVAGIEPDPRSKQGRAVLQRGSGACYDVEKGTSQSSQMRIWLMITWWPRPCRSCGLAHQGGSEPTIEPLSR